ncbi:hypothetical protein FO675_06175 [Riemerella anatipestifer]|uniref:hypothetical protein n=1 Tax=Riemerella anatipestifer TaxID=34085 RepID=UPI001AD75CBD|nr:hypothetical protein [Riemerella anatipestifer]MBO4233889.1 hypothetical protein [Riemerella anatipestifer]
MKTDKFPKFISDKARKLKIYTETVFPTKAGNIALRFINGNFRAKGFQGTTFKKWESTKRGKSILVDTGKLRASNYTTKQSGQVTIKNHMPYAKVHNEGFNKKVLVKAHHRNKYSKTKVGTGLFTKKGKERTKIMTFKSGEGKVRAHTRKMNIKQRQFIPTESSPSPILNNAVMREVTKDINKIMNND